MEIVVDVKALVASPRALRWLRTSHRVILLHRFERACNLVNERGHVLSLVTSPAAMGPFSVLVDQIPPISSNPLIIQINRIEFSDALAEASTRGFETSLFVSPGRVLIDLRRAQIWQPQPEWDMLRAARSKLMEQIIDLNALVHSCSPQGSLVDMLPFSSPMKTPDAVPGVSPAISVLAGELEGSHVRSMRLLRRSAPRNDTRREGLLRRSAPRKDIRRGDVHDRPVFRSVIASRNPEERGGKAKQSPGNDLFAASLLRAAKDPARKLRDGIFSFDNEGISHAAGQLTGLGGGLTPAGDDFLLGAMCAVWLVTPARQAEEVGSAIVRGASGRTTRLSTAWLRAAARGEFGAPWHDLLHSLVSRDRVDLEKAASVILSTGHTSGADALAGFLAVAYESYCYPR